MDTFILVMPSYNEAGRIEKTIKSWAKVITKIPGSEILIVDGNSTDATATIIRKLTKKWKFLKLVQKAREGYGKDLIHGYKLALKTPHKWFFQTDNDLSYNPQDFFKLWEKRNDSPLVIGRRHKRKDLSYRLVMAFIIFVLVRLLFQKVIVDSNVPFRLIKKDFLKKVISEIPPETIAPNIFLSILAANEGHNLQHIPVTHYFSNNSANTKRLLMGALKGITELLKFRASK